MSQENGKHKLEAGQKQICRGYRQYHGPRFLASILLVQGLKYTLQ